MKLDDKKITELLIEQHYITEKDVEGAKESSKKEGISLIDQLLSDNLITEDLLGQAMAEFFKVPYVNLKKTKIDNDVFSMIPEVVATSNEVIAITKTEKGVKLGMSNPHDIETRHLMEKRFGDIVIPHYITPWDFKNALERYRTDLKVEFNKITDELQNPDLDNEEKDALSIKMVDTLLKYGHQSKASDIHVEPYENKIMVRFRIDGIMHDVLEIPKKFSDLIVTRIKILSKMRTDEHRAAQDGKLRFETEKEKVDVRASVVPVSQGENIVMRILSSQNRQFGLSSIGLSDGDKKKVNDAIRHPHGMILVTGPTGSGKTTSLYAVLKILNKRDVHISTIEDPIEYDIEGVSQIQVNTKTDLTFAKGLRAIVRQDPDIIMVGEIRDEETANIAVNSALTGHLVLSTFHTNDAATALPRFLEMNIEPFLVASTINIVIAQRLVRKICEKCRFSYQLTPDEIKIIESNPEIKEAFKKKSVKNIRKTNFYKGAGCVVCGHTGYKGRLGIFEALEMDNTIKELVLKRSSSDDIEKQARKNGMTTMFEDGVEKVLSGITTLEEVMRVSRD